MIAFSISLIAVVLAYLIGSIPFGLLIARWFGKVDIRTVGSGNIGATNVGRVLGLRFFAVVFLLDFFKGFLPTFYFAGLASRIAGRPLVELPVLVAVGAILGHNFPLYLKFKGGKGVATSLGSVFALDPLASVASATGFAFFLVLTGYVSMSSILGGLVWLIAHFIRIAEPWGREEIALTVASLGLMGLLVIRHRKNLVRIGAGTEPKVKFREKKEKKDKGRPSGRVSTILVAALVVLAGAVAFALNASRKFEVVAGAYRAVEVARVATGHQRAERLAFADHGKLLAATCPRYGRVMLYRVTEANGLALERDIGLEGRPVALGSTVDRLFVLVRPNNDARHVEEGWWETFDLQGKPIGPKVHVGLYPDDLAITPDGKKALVLTSGRGEGGNHRPLPALQVYDFATTPENPRVVGHVAFDQPGDDPSRLALTEDGTMAAVSLRGSNAVVWVDLADLGHPRLAGRRAWPSSSSPNSLRFDHQGGLLAVDEADQALRYQTGPDAEPTVRPIEGGIGEVAEISGEPNYWALTLPFDSSVAFLRSGSSLDQPLARLPLKGRANLASTRPQGLAYNADRRLLAVANRSGGSVHLIAVREPEPSRRIP